MGAHQSTCSGAEGRRLLKAAEDGCLPAVDACVSDNPLYVCFSSLSGGNTMWHKAAKAGRLGVLKALAAAVSAAYAAPKGTDAAANLGMLLRLGSSPAEAVRRLVNAVNFKRCTPLMLAAGHGHANVVEWLLQQGAVLLVHDRIRNQTALHYAVQSGDGQCVRLLLTAANHVAPADAGDAPSPRRQQQQSPCPQLSERQLLLAAGNHAGLTALHYAVHEDAHDAARLLLAHGADVNAQADYPDLDFSAVNAGDTPLHIAASRGSIDAIHVLLKGFVETSGLLCPEHAPPRHIRDPRGVRNDYGRLPYHLAMRRRFTWLAELLDPSVPIRYLLTGEEPDTGAAFGPPRLTTIAAKALHDKLLRELAAIKAASGGGFGSACGLGRGSSCGGGVEQGEEDVPVIPNSLQRAQAEQAAASAATGHAWRLWQLGGSGRRRSGDSGGRDGAAADAQLAQGEAGPGDVSTGPISPRRSLPGLAAGTAATPDRRGTPPPTVDCSSPSPQLRSLGLSPRISTSNIGAEGAATPAPGRSRRASCDGSVTPAAAPAQSLAAAIYAVAAALSPSAPLLEAKRGDACIAGGAGDAAAVQLQASAELEPAADACEAGSCGGDCAGQATVKVSPLSPDALVAGYACGRAAQAAASDGRRGSLDSCSSGVTCGVCLDAPPATCILPCAHVMCVDCALDMTKRYSLGTAACPFCRALVAAFRPAARHEMRQQ